MYSVLVKEDMGRLTDLILLVENSKKILYPLNFIIQKEQ